MKLGTQVSTKPLQRQVPFHQAMGLLLTGRRIPAAEALRIGLTNEVARAAELDAAMNVAPSCLEAADLNHECAVAPGIATQRGR
jgi:enoyl-CoA hydratase/carnithine racemase